MNGYTLLIRASETGRIAYDMPEPYKTELRERSMALYHEAALDEYRRRMQNDKPDDRHLRYL